MALEKEGESKELRRIRIEIEAERNALQGRVDEMENQRVDAARVAQERDALGSRVDEIEREIVRRPSCPIPQTSKLTPRQSSPHPKPWVRHP